MYLTLVIAEKPADINKMPNKTAIMLITWKFHDMLILEFRI